MNTTTDFGWQLTPEMQAALDAANARLAQLAEQHAPAAAPARPPRLARELMAWGEFALQPAGAALLEADLAVPAFLQRLLQHDALADARRVLAHSLPKRRALWWGTLVAWDALRERITEHDRAVLAAVTQFITEPTEDRRRACGQWLKQTRKNSLAGTLAAAAYFSAGSVSPIGMPPVAPRHFVTGRLAGVVVYLAAVARDAALYKQYLREYLKWGQQIAAGEMLWPAPSAADNVLRTDEPQSRLEPYWNSLPRALAAKTGEIYA